MAKNKYSKEELKAVVEEAQRELARKKLIYYAKYIYPRYIADELHKIIAEKLDQITKGQFKKKGLMIFCPPQHGKSHLISRIFPTFYLSHNPNSPIILASYAAAHANRFGRAARTFMESHEHKQLFPDIRVDQSHRAVDQWSLEPPYEGFMLSSGVGGPITGSGAQIGIIDDPFKNWEEANSLTIRERVWEWYQSVFLTRLWEHGKIIVVMTRWHKDDLAGRIIKNEGSQWEILRFTWIRHPQDIWEKQNEICGLPRDYPEPTTREIGEVLAPHRFSREALEEKRGTLSALMWAALYDQAPTDPEGDRIKRSHFIIVNNVPYDEYGRPVRFKNLVRYWDPAGSKTKTSKFTAGVLMAKYRDNYYILDVVRGQWETAERNSVMYRTAIKDKANYGFVWQIWEEEGGSSGKDASVMYSKLFQEFPHKADRPTGSKDIRLEPFISALENARIFMLRGEWNEDYLDEMTSESDVRDQKDATAGAFNFLHKSFEQKGWR